MRHAVYLLLVLVAVLQVCWLGEDWVWTTATLVVGAIGAEVALGPELQHGEVGGPDDHPDHAQGGQEPRQ